MTSASIAHAHGLVRAGVLALIFALWTVLILQVLPLLAIAYTNAELRIGTVILLVALFGFTVSVRPNGLLGKLFLDDRKVPTA